MTASPLSHDQMWWSSKYSARCCSGGHAEGAACYKTEVVRRWIGTRLRDWCLVLESGKARNFAKIVLIGWELCIGLSGAFPSHGRLIKGTLS